MQSKYYINGGIIDERRFIERFNETDRVVSIQFKRIYGIGKLIRKITL